MSGRTDIMNVDCISKSEIADIITKLNDIYFEAVKKIYDADFQGSRNIFLGTVDLLGKIIEYSMSLEVQRPGSKLINVRAMTRTVDEIINSFEKMDFQTASDLMLYDLSSILNECKDEMDALN